MFAGSDEKHHRSIVLSDATGTHPVIGRPIDRLDVQSQCGVVFHQLPDKPPGGTLQ